MECDLTHSPVCALSSPPLTHNQELCEVVSIEVLYCHMATLLIRQKLDGKQFTKYDIFFVIVAGKNP